MSTELTIPPATPSTGALLAAVVERGVTTDNVEAIERLCALKEREEARAAAREFAVAFAQLQIETPKIEARKPVPDNSGNVRYKFAPYEDIMKAVRPLLNKHGFAITYDQEIEDGKVTVSCTLLHVGGHSKTNKHTSRIGSGPPKASEAQADGAGTTYARRFALCAALGITIETDTDGGKDEGDGSTITKEQAAELRLSCEETKTDMHKFCAWLGVTSFDDIKAQDWERASAKLKERATKK